MRPNLFAVLAVVALTVSACMRPYARSELDPADGHFTGITAYWGQSASSRVRVLFVHGMCTHTEDGWVTHGWDRSIQEYFGIDATDVKQLPDLPTDHATIVQRDYQIGASMLSARYLLWSSLTAGDKAAIQFDDPPPPPGAFNWKRATLNAELKVGLLNDCLSDAVIYAGARGPTLALAIRNAICRAFDGAVTPQGCTFPASTDDPAAPLILVTESLGSRMVFDALVELEVQARAQGETALAAFDRAVAPVSEVFMLANQIPLLGLAETAPVPHSGATVGAAPPSSTLIRGVQTIAAARERQRTRSPRPQPAGGPPPPITIVAFTDPNDLLSYRLAPESAPAGPLVEVVNVITSNDGALLGYVENPMSAHVGYRTNPDVLKLLFGGSDRSARTAGANARARASAADAAHSR